MHLYCAGGENKSTIPLLDEGACRRAFVSVMNGEKEREDNRALESCHRHCKSVIVDSGAHSFFAATGHNATNRRSLRKLPEPDEYMAWYRGWLKAHYDLIDYYVELDIGRIVGQPKVYEWQEQLRKDGLLDKFIPVYHPGNESLDVFLARAIKLPARYVGLEGVRSGVTPMDYVAVTRACYEAGVRVHGFAMMKPKWLTRVPFYSVDSSSWLGGTMWSNLLYPEPDGQPSFLRLAQSILKSPKAKRKLARVSELADLNAICDTDPKVSAPARNRLGMMAYACYEDWLDRYWRAKGVLWNEQVSKAQTRSRRRKAHCPR